MPQEIIVSSSLKVGAPAMIGVVKHFVGRRETRTEVPITLLSLTTLKVGNGNGIRQIISSITVDGETSHERAERPQKCG
jgi:hypothetical protein